MIMPRMTPIELAAYQARRAPALPEPDRGTGERESKLHEAIRLECSRRGWLAFCGAMHRRSWRTRGEPDFAIAVPGGLTLWVECKTRDGRLSDDQIDVATQMRAIGHNVHVVRSMARFVEVARMAERDAMLLSEARRFAVGNDPYREAR